MSFIMRQRFAIALIALFGPVCGCTSKFPPRTDSNVASALTTADIGFVLEVKGDWRLKGHDDTPIVAGDILPAQGILMRVAGSNDDGEVVVSLCTGKVETYRKSPSQLEKRLDDQQVNPLWTLAGKRYHSDLISAQSRGDKDENNLRDDVVLLQNENLHLASVFEKMPPGAYRLRLEPIQDLTEENATSVILLDVYEWSPSSKPSLKVEPNLRGAYELYAVAVDTANPEAASLAVICAPGEYDQLGKDFQAARELVSSWGEVTSPSVNRRFLQATLASLAAGIVPSNPSK